MFPFYMAPRVDGNYLPAHPAQLLREGRYNKVDIMAGVTQHEGGVLAIPAYSTPAGEQLIADFPIRGPISVGMDQEERGLYLTRRIYYHYLGGGNITLTEDNADQVVKMYSDLMFKMPHDLVSQHHARDTSYGRKLYMFQLEQNGEASFFDFQDTGVGFEWVDHGEDIPFLFDGTLLSKPFQRAENLFLQDVMVNLWTNFAATGNPTPDLSLGFKWSATSPSNLHYLSLQPDVGMRPDPRTQIREFYSNLPTKQNKMLFPERFPADSAQKAKKESGFCHA